MAFTEQTSALAEIHTITRDILTSDGKFRNPSTLRTAQMFVLGIEFADLGSPFPADSTHEFEIDASALATIFKERDERDPACNCFSQVFLTAFSSLANHGFDIGCDKVQLRLGERLALILPVCDLMFNGVPGAAVNNPVSISRERQRNRTNDQETVYYPDGDVGQADSANVAQIIILAQAQGKAIKAGTISNDGMS